MPTGELMQQINHRFQVINKLLMFGELPLSEWHEHLYAYLGEESSGRTYDTLTSGLFNECLDCAIRLGDMQGFAGHLQRFISKPRHPFARHEYWQEAGKSLPALTAYGRIFHVNRLFEEVFASSEMPRSSRRVTGVVIPMTEAKLLPVIALHHRYKLRPATAYELLYFLGAVPGYRTRRPVVTLGARYRSPKRGQLLLGAVKGGTEVIPVRDRAPKGLLFLAFEK